MFYGILKLGLIEVFNLLIGGLYGIRKLGLIEER